MELGLLWLLASWGISLNDWVITYGFALFFYGIGVGGEYPMTATAAMENPTGSGLISSREDRLHRGRKVCQAFLMQGWGQFWNLVVLIILLLISNHGSGDGPYNQKIAQIVFRISFALPAIGTLWLVWYRVYKMPLASKQLDAAKKKSNVTGYDTKSLGMTCAYFGSRLFGAAGTWFCNDVFFYGNKLFQGEFIRVLSPGGASLMTIWLWSLLNTGVSLAGYYVACKSLHHNYHKPRLTSFSTYNRQQALRTKMDDASRLPYGLHPLHYSSLSLRLLHLPGWRPRFPGDVLPLLFL